MWRLRGRKRRNNYGTDDRGWVGRDDVTWLGCFGNIALRTWMGFFGLGVGMAFHGKNQRRMFERIRVYRVGTCLVEVWFRGAEYTQGSTCITFHGCSSFYYKRELYLTTRMEDSSTYRISFGNCHPNSLFSTSLDSSRRSKRLQLSL